MSFVLEPTNACNLKCLHCIRDKLEDRRFISLDVVQKALREARSYGFNHISVTGGEPTLHPQLDQLLDMIAREGFGFHIVTNGFQFRSRVLPLLLKPHVRRHLSHIAISLDGASARTHDANRGEGAFKVAMEMASLCKLKAIPIKLSTVINNFNKNELADIALLGSGLGAAAHLFAPLIITPLSISRGIAPSPRETKTLMSYVTHTLAKALKVPVALGTGGYCSSALVQCGAFTGYHVNVDYSGKAIFCCTLSHPADDGARDGPGKEVLADLKREPLAAAITRQKEVAARLIEGRLAQVDRGLLADKDYFPCYWCFKQFGKLEWLKGFPDSPWVDGLSQSGACSAVGSAAP